METATIPPVTFGQPDGAVASVSLHGRPAGEIRRHSGDIWTYEHGDASFVGTHIQVRRAIQRHHATPIPTPTE